MRPRSVLELCPVLLIKRLRQHRRRRRRRRRRRGRDRRQSEGEASAFAEALALCENLPAHRLAELPADLRIRQKSHAQPGRIGAKA